MIKPIRVFTEKDHGEPKDWRNHLIHPIRSYWGDGTVEWERWKDDFTFYKDYFKIANNIKESDVGFLPLTLNYYIKNNKLSLVDEMADTMKANDKNLYVWIEGDHINNYNHENCIFIKYFSDSRYQTPKEIIQPGDMKEDLLDEYYKGQLNKRKKSNIPVIGFDGIANYPKIKLIGTIAKNYVRNVSYKILNRLERPDSIIPFFLKRRQLLDKLKMSKEVRTNFTIRDSFAPGTIGGNSEARNDFIRNINSSDYTFCYRGAANYSLRFYETLCLGRIPLFINSNCVLPFNEMVDWKNTILWIEENESDYMVEKIMDFHLSMTNDQFIEKQQYCREIWVKYLSKKGFIKHFHDSIIKSI